MIKNIIIIQFILVLSCKSILAQSAIYSTASSPAKDSMNCVFNPEGKEWGIRLDWASDENVSYIIPLIGDLDNDGHPEIVTFTPHTEPGGPHYLYNLLVFDGVTKQLKTTIALPSSVSEWDEAPYGIVKLPSGEGLIVVACTDYKLRAYNITAPNPSIPYWVSSENYGVQYGDWASNVNFADFNNDGHPEVFIRNKIYNAETGVLLASASGGSNTGSSYAHWTHPSIVQWKVSAPIASNIIGDSCLELILGNEIYSVIINNPNGTNGNSVNMVLNIIPPSGVPQDGHSQVADFDNDGFLDVFISLRTSASVMGIVYGYVWDVHNNTISQPFMVNTTFSGKSTPLIADVDNDGKVEVVIQCAVSGTTETFLAYKYNSNSRIFSLLWSYYADEDSFSNSITAFDFNQDELLELLISDQSAIRIINGSGKSHLTHNDTLPVYAMTTLPLPQVTCMQYPVIVDADNDGSADIVSVSNDKLILLKSSTEPWPPTRKVWNQYMYNITCVNDDLTIPQYLFDNATSIIDPQGIVRRPYNNFLQQMTTLDQFGRPVYPIPDAVAISTNFIVESGNMVLNMTYTNQGDNFLNAPYNITVFANQFGGQILYTFTVNIPLFLGETVQQNIALPLSDLCSLQDVSTLVVAINCAGGGIAQNGGLQPECDITNNTAQVAINFQSDPTTITEIACDQFTWNGNTYSQSGQYQQMFQDSYGCDSIVIMDLTITTTSEPTFFSDTACDQYQWNGISYLQSGQYQQLFQNSNGCDSIAILDLTIETASNYSIHGKSAIFPSTDITSGQYSYFVDSTGINPFNVHWDIDREDWLLIPHGASCDLVCMSEGQAVLHAWTEGELCDVDTTMVLNATFYSIGESNTQSASVYPNPTSGKVTIIWQDIVAIKVFNLLGQKVDEYKFGNQDKAELDMLNYQEGVYVLEISTSDKKAYKSVVLTK